MANTGSNGAVKGKYTYAAFGSSNSQTGAPFLYAGMRVDAETGTYYARARAYNPALGRFLQSDPIGPDGGINLYAYANNDPLNLTDTSGNCPSCAWGAVIGFGVDFAAQAYFANLNNQSIWDTYDWRQGITATGIGALTGGMSAFAGSAIQGTGVLAIGARAAANSVIGAAGSLAQTSILNNWEDRTDSYVAAALWGGLSGGAGSVAGDLASIIGSKVGLSALISEGLSVGSANLWDNMASQSGYQFTRLDPTASMFGAVIGNTLGNASAFMPSINPFNTTGISSILTNSELSSVTGK